MCFRDIRDIASQNAMDTAFDEEFGIEYLQGYLKTQIGKKVRVEFLIGTDTLQDRLGTLMDVAISYIIIREEETDDLLMCDMYSIKFVTIYK